MDDLDAVTDAALLSSRAMLGVIARSVALALEDVSLPQFRVLVLLSRDGSLRPGVVADHLGVHPSTFSRNADRLVAGGWVRRVDDPDRRHSVLIELTESGRALVDHATEQRRNDLAEILGRLPVEERKAVLDAFRALAEAAGEPDPRDLRTLAI
jgi:DNA-binding MarR family transcriptional regulator